MYCTCIKYASECSPNLPPSVSGHGETGQGSDCVCFLYLSALSRRMTHVQQAGRAVQTAPVGFCMGRGRQGGGEGEGAWGRGRGRRQGGGEGEGAGEEGREGERVRGQGKKAGRGRG